MISRKYVQLENPRVIELESWLINEYPKRLAIIEMHKVLGLEGAENERVLHLEAYNKMQEMRKLQGKELLPEIKNKKLL